MDRGRSWCWKLFGMRVETVRAVMPFPFTVWTFAYIGFKIGIVELRIVQEQAAFDAAQIALHDATTGGMSGAQWVMYPGTKLANDVHHASSLL